MCMKCKFMNWVNVIRLRMNENDGDGTYHASRNAGEQLVTEVECLGGGGMFDDRELRA